MPTTRRTSLPPSTSSSTSTPIRTPAIDRLAPSSSRSNRSARASSLTPRAKSSEAQESPSHHVHHMTADEQMLQEAEKFLTKSAKRVLRSEGSVSGSLGDLGSPRDKRHAKINEARHREERESEATNETRDEDEEQTSAGAASTSQQGQSVNSPRSWGKAVDGAVSPRVSVGMEESEEVEEAENGDMIDKEDENDDETPGGEKPSPAGQLADVGDKDVDTIQDSISAINGDDIDNAFDDMDRDDVGGSTAPIRAVNGTDGEVEIGSEEDSSSSASSSSSDSDSDSDSDEESDSDGDSDTSEDSDAEEERLEKLLQAAKISALAKQQGKIKPSDTDTETGEVLLQFDEEKKEAPIPDLRIPTLPKAHISFKPDGSAQASSSASVLPSKAKPIKKSVKGKEKATEPELDDRPYERQMSKREKAAQPKKASASELWATLPSARADALPQMKRDYQALSLANSLDPKRFMKGGTKINKVPEMFAIGTMVDHPRHLQDTTLAKTTQYRPGQIVQSIVQDEGLGATAKRKYGDLQWKRMENGRGKGWKKRSKW